MTLEALEGLLKALPRCCNCQTAAAVVIDFYRWPLCEKCWKAVPGSDDEPPSADMRDAVRVAQKAFRSSLTDSLARLPLTNEIPPPSIPPKVGAAQEHEELEASLRRTRKRYRDLRAQSRAHLRRAGVFAFLMGVLLSSVVFALLR